MTTTPRLWKTLTQVNTTDNANAQFDAQIVALPDGGYVVVFTDGSHVHNPVGDAILGQRYDSAGNEVGGEVFLSQFNTGNDDSPAVTVLPNGNIAMAFVDVFSDAASILVFIFTTSIPGVPLGLIRIDTIEERRQFETLSDPAITAFADGSYAVAFTFTHFFNQTSDSADLARIVSPTGVRGPLLEIDSDPADNQESAQLATLSNGNFVAVDMDEFNGDRENIDIPYTIFTPTGTPVTGRQFVPGAGDPVAEVFPDVAALRDGGFVVVWTDNAFAPSADDPVADIRVSILTNTGGNVASDILVNTTPAVFAIRAASVVALADGGFLVNWVDSDDSLVRAQRFDAVGHKIGAEFTVTEGLLNGFSEDLPAAALLTDGRIAFAFSDGAIFGSDVTTSIWTTRWPADPHLNYFNSDGPSDILWQGSDGTPAIWLMNGTNAVGVGAAGSFNPGPSWHVKAGGDFNGDDRSDIVWQHDNGAAALWLMDGTNVTFAGQIGPFNPGPNWHVEGTGDFNGDGKSDIIWQGDDGTAAMLLMDGPNTKFAGAVGPFNPGPSWEIKGTGDFNGDGKSDIIWQGENGTAAMWLMDGPNATFVGAVGPFNPGPNWHVEGTGDFNGDNKSDILWQSDDGTPAIWFMDGMNFIGGGVAGSFNPGHDWHVIA
jgi:FG-GAP-like repeat